MNDHVFGLLRMLRCLEEPDCKVDALVPKICPRSFRLQVSGKPPWMRSVPAWWRTWLAREQGSGPPGARRCDKERVELAVLYPCFPSSLSIDVDEVVCLAAVQYIHFVHDKSETVVATESSQLFPYRCLSGFAGEEVGHAQGGLCSDRF